jgi:hypothetical protein
MSSGTLLPSEEILAECENFLKIFIILIESNQTPVHHTHRFSHQMENSRNKMVNIKMLQNCWFCCCMHELESNSIFSLPSEEKTLAP